MNDTTKTVLKIAALLVVLWLAWKITVFLVPIVVVAAVGYWLYDKFIKNQADIQRSDTDAPT